MTQFTLQDAANVVAVGVPLITLIVVLARYLSRRAKVTALEEYLRTRKQEYRAGRSDSYQHSIPHLAAKLGMNQEELLQASSRSKKINRIPTQNANGMATGILFEYRD